MHSPILYIIETETEQNEKDLLKKSKDELLEFIPDDDFLFDHIHESDYISDSRSRTWKLSDVFSSKDVVLEDTSNPYLKKIKITKESLLNYQNDFISQLNKWVELLNKNNNKSEIIFNNSNFGKDWTPYDFKQKIQPCGGAYFNIHSFKDGYDLVRHYNQLIETAADSMTLFNLDEISYFVITDEIGDYHY